MLRCSEFDNLAVAKRSLRTSRFNGKLKPARIIFYGSKATKCSWILHFTGQHVYLVVTFFKLVNSSLSKSAIPPFFYEMGTFLPRCCLICFYIGQLIRGPTISNLAEVSFSHFWVVCCSNICETIIYKDDEIVLTLA